MSGNYRFVEVEKLSESQFCAELKAVTTDGQPLRDEKKRDFVTIALGMGSAGLVHDEKVHNLSTNFLSENSVLTGDMRAFSLLYNEGQFVFGNRNRLMVCEAILGRITTAALIDELTTSQDAQLADTIVNKEGLDCEITKEGKLVIYTLDDSRSIEEMFGSESEEARIARELDLSVGSFQYELMTDKINNPYFKSANSHSSLGTFDDNGEYVPHVTVLDEEHPARMR